MSKEILIPSTLGDITLGRYQKIAAKGEDIKDDELLSIITNSPLEVIYELPSKVYKQVIERVDKVLLGLEDNHPLQMRFKLNGTEYGMIPNLDEISYGENKDLTTYLGDWKTMHLAMAVLYRPIVDTYGKTYKIEKYKGTKEHRDIMIHMPIDIVLSSHLFFYSLTKELLKAIPSYLEAAMKDHSPQERLQIQEEYTKLIGEAMTSFTALRKEI